MTTAYDALGRRTARNAERYGYNDRSELISAATNGTDDYAYAYDDIGNRETVSELGTNYVYAANALNQYTSVGRVAPRSPEDDFEPQYDEDGNQTLVRTATGIWSVSYNAENRPVRWTRGNTVVTMDFDSMGRRTFYREMEGNRQITFTRFFYDGYLMIQQLFSNAPYNIYKEFIWDPTEPVATKPLCFRQNGQAATFLTHDGNKDVSDVVRVSPYNDSVGHYDYAPFGAVTAQTGNRASANPFRFSSEFADDALGLVYYNYRHYEPMTGRWLTRDPLEEVAGLSLYAGCNNNFVSVCDVLGQNWFDCFSGCVREWHLDWDKVFSSLAALGSVNTPVPKTATEKLWISEGVSEDTTYLSRVISVGERLARKLPLGSPIRAEIIRALGTIRRFMRNPALIKVGAAGAAITVFEGFYDIGVMIYCSAHCCGSEL